ncbi:2Fe-2S iron-sulfur cluster binding domain-containing protein [Paraburkholderia sp. CNPSo 3157]|uniref:2Fe-2S iron-sulfur cluster binding domain-containing protein n=1 Tax=Paraburkholderia franconis TaxID=2654983 RepID=A0A7X1NIH3_9BURK|nr:PDR/VanB family oxidoreductase [Paraburkholderia franconis]MPW22251.1 2Fe-2S iron-sulfur cluster binding domain-containing protein [Paraburkholderia franconis]
MLELRVRSIVNEAIGINAYELVAPGDDLLPAFTAGSHIDVHIPGGFVRQYSLCNDPRERHRYLIGVLNVVDGRGGSAALHAGVRAGDALRVSTPRNNFQLSERARHHLLIAGGIGITPMLAMVETLEARGDSYTLHYCAREPRRAAFLDRLEGQFKRGRAIAHYDRGVPSDGLPVTDLLRKPEPGTHLYYCGPVGLMSAIARASAHWPQGTVHCEYFAAPPAVWPRETGEAADAVATGGFRIKIASSGQLLSVPAEKSIVQVLREAGMSCETSCEAGVCGTCKTRYLEGTPEHCDYVLDDVEKGEYLMPCCSRSKSELLVLDL